MNEEKPPKAYAWLTENRLNFALKVLLAAVLGLYLFGYLWQFLARLGSITFILVGAIFFAYIIYPVVRWLNRKLPLVVAILIVYAVIIALVVLGVYFLIPALVNDAMHVGHILPLIDQRVRDFVQDPTNPLMRRAPLWLKNEAIHFPDQMVSYVRMHGTQTASKTLSFLVGTFALFATFIVVPVLAAYLLLDSEHLKRVFIATIPGPRRNATLDILSELEQVIGGFIRGQMLVGATVGIMITAVLLIFHVPYALLIGLIAAVGDLIPYVGAFLAWLPALVLAAINNGMYSALLVTVGFVVIFQIEGHFIAPNIVSRSLSLSPLAVLLAILIGGELGGILGMFVSVPIAGMLRVMMIHIFPPKVSIEEAKPALTEAPHDEVMAAQAGEAASP